MQINSVQTIDKWDVNIIINRIEEKLNRHPERFKFNGVYPNPFNASTTFSFYLAESMEVTIDAFNVRGELVVRIQNNKRGPGEHQVIWDANHIASGKYIIRIRAGDEIVTQGISLIK